MQIDKFKDKFTFGANPDKFTFGASWQVQRKVPRKNDWQVLKWQDSWQSKMFSTRRSNKSQVSDSIKISLSQVSKATV